MLEQAAAAAAAWRGAAAARLVAERKALEGAGQHLQPPAAARAGSKAGCACGALGARQRRPKAAGMSLSWLKGRRQSGKLKAGWAPGPASRAGYATKSHPGLHRQVARPAQLCAKGKRPTALQGLGRATGASRPAKGAKVGLAGKLKGSLPSIGAKRLQALTF